MARRLKAKDKLVRKRVRGALVEENLRTKKWRKVGKRETEQELVRSEALLEQEEQGSIRGERSASRRLNRSAEGEQPGRARSGSAKTKAAMKRLRHDADEQREILTSSRTDPKRRVGRSVAGAAADEVDPRFALDVDDRYDEDVLLDEDALSWEDDTPDAESSEGAGKRNSIYRHHLKSGERFRDAERDTRSTDLDESDADDVELEDEKDGDAETRLKAKKQRLHHQADNFRNSEAAEEAADGTAKEKKQRLRHQAETFREAEASEKAAKETFEELTDAEVSRTEGIAAVKKKSRLNHSDESGPLRMVSGAGRIARKTVGAAAVPAKLYVEHELYEAGKDNTAVESVETGALVAKETTRLADKSVRKGNLHKSANRMKELSEASTVQKAKENAAQTEHRKKEQIKAFQKKRRQRAVIAAKKKESVVSAGGFVDSANTVFSIPAKAKEAAKTFFSEHKGAIIGVAVAGMLFALFALALTSAASVVQGSGTSVITTTYLSTDEDIYAAENAYCALEDALNSQVYGLRASHPGYDDYEYQVDDIGHNPYHLISYLQVKFGGFTYNDEIKAELQRLIRQQYSLSVSDKSEMRTRMETVTGTEEVIDPETGEITLQEYEYEVEVEYEHRTQYAVLMNRDFDIVARENLTAEELVLYNALNTTYGNRDYLFDKNASYGGGSAGIKYEIPPEALSDVKFANMIREAEKYLGMPYVWGGKSVRTGFDCSGFVCWVLNHCGNGWNVGQKRAKELCRMCIYVSPQEARPGDLVFFEKTYDTDGASHVGIYVGNNTMIHCGNPIKYGRIDTRYFKAHFLCFGRLPFYDD